MALTTVKNLNNENERRSVWIINTIDANKDKDLCKAAEVIAEELKSADVKTAEGRKVVEDRFVRLCDINYAEHHGLGTEFLTERLWGYAENDRKILDSFRMQHLGSLMGMRPCPPRLSFKQLNWLKSIISRPFYTMQLALVEAK